MSTARKLALIAVGFVLAVAGGFGLVALNELLIPTDISQTSGGMVAFGDMIVFVLGVGFLGLLPTWFLLKLWYEKAPRILLTVLLLIAIVGPLSWLAVALLAGGPPPNPPLPGSQFLGVLIAFGAIPRIIVGPVLVLAEAAAFFLFKSRPARALLIAAMLMDLVPLGLYALHFAVSAYRYGSA